MIQLTYYNVPVGNFLWVQKRAKNPQLDAYAKELESVQTYGGIVVDTMGFGKTFAGLLFYGLYIQFSTNTAGLR